MKGLDLDKAISLAVSDFGRHFLRLAPVFLLVAVATNLLNGLILQHMLASDDPTDIAFGPLLLSVFVSFAAFGVDVVMTDNVMRHGRLKPGDAALRVLRRLPVLLLTILAFYLAFFVGFVLLIIPAFIVMVTLGYAWFLVLLDDAGPVDALSGSFRLVWGNAWLVFAANLLWGIVYGVLIGALLVLLPGSFEETVALMSDGLAYADWRRWLIDIAGVIGGAAYLFLNLRILEDLKRLKSESSDTTAAEADLTA